LLFFLELPQELLLEVALHDRENCLDTVELWAIRYVEDRHNAKGLHGFDRVL
jgi:hypothetical protein